MQFRKSSKTPYLNQGDQLRMLRMVGLLVLVVVCMKFAADPGMWSWMFPNAAPEQTEAKPQPKDIDYGVKFEEESPLAPDAFRSKGDPTERRVGPPKPAIAEASPERSQSSKSATAKIGDYEIKIDPKILEPVSDDWLEIRQKEAPAFYTVLVKSRDIPLKLLEDAADRDVDYTVLMTDSERYRGLPLTVEGTIRRIDHVKISRAEIREEYRIEDYYVAWMFTESSGNNPYRLIANSIPSDMPTGENIEVSAKFTGYFFKRQGYQAQHGVHKAPVLIGKHIRWNRPEDMGTLAIAQDSGLAPYAIGFAVIVALGLGLMIWRFNVSDKKFGHKHVDHFTTATPAAIEELQNLETTDPRDLFRQMEEDAIAAELESEESQK